jgi:hypothetical protein
MKDEIPGYVTTENYDITRNLLVKSDKKVKQLEHDLQQALFFKADKISENTVTVVRAVVIRGKKEISDLAFEMLKSKADIVRITSDNQEIARLEVIKKNGP